MYLQMDPGWPQQAAMAMCEYGPSTLLKMLEILLIQSLLHYVK
jgi:hypothetical protein